MLCAACDAYRSPPKNTSSIALKNGVSTQPKSVDHDNVNVSNPVDKGAILVAEKFSDPVTKPVSVNLEVNDVLCFVKNKFGNHPQTVIKSTMYDFFREDEILSAKQSLVNAVKGKGLNVHQYSKSRIGPNKIKACVDDIFGIWVEVDEEGLMDQLPAYCSVMTSRIPVLTDDLTDMASMKRTISQMCEKLNVLQAEVADVAVIKSSVYKLNESVAELKLQLSDLHAEVTSHNITSATDTADIKHRVEQLSSSFTDISSHNFRSMQLCARSSTDTHPAATGTSDSVSTIGVTVDRSALQNDVINPASTLQSNADPLPVLQSGSSGETRDGTSPSDIGNSAVTCTPVNSYAGVAKISSCIEDNNFVVVQHKKKSGAARRFVVGGSTSNESFKGVMKKSVFCVNRLEPGTTTETVSDFFNSKGYLCVVMLFSEIS